MHKWRQRAVRFGDYLNLAFFFYWLIIITHWLACGWLSLKPGQSGGDDFRNYLTSLYWCTQTLTTVGYGDIDVQSNGQIIYAMMVMLFGVAMYGYVIGNVASILGKRDPAKTQFFKNIDTLKAFVRFRDIPFELQKRIRDYYAYIWKQRLGYDESEFMRELPEGLKNEVTSFLKKDILEKIPLFKGISDKFVREVSLHLRPVVYTPGDYIFREGDRGNEMYFVIKGKLKVMSGDETVIYNTLSDGDFFGEIALFKNQPRTATIQAITYSDLYTLEKKVFELVLQNYPEITDQIKKISEDRLKNSNMP
jgi:voltage-gated potassium channel